MSSTIWTQCAGETQLRAIRRKAWRVVEAQHISSSLKLTRTPADHDLLENLLETQAKPPRTDLHTSGEMHWLLHTPFRYRSHSRFATRFERNLWYGAAEPRTAFAEIAYYRFRFLAETAASLDPLSSQLTAFQVSTRTARGIDLSRPPFDQFSDDISSPSSYQATQSLGTAMREAGVELVVYPSARDIRGSVNIGLFTPKAFAKKSPLHEQTWSMDVNPTRAIFTRRYGDRYVFARSQFLIEGALPRP